MGKIPRIDLGNRPSAVPSGGGFSPAAVAAPTAALGNAVDAGYAAVSDYERSEALKIKAAREAKQGIVNEVESGRRSTNFDAMLRESSENIQKEYWDEPQNAVSAFMENARGFADVEVRDAASYNSAVGLSVAQSANSSIDTHTRAMFTWAEDRQTQKTKGDMEAILNRVAAGAEHETSPASLSKYLDKAIAQNRSQIEAVYGKQADEKTNELRARSTEAYFRVSSDANPLGALAALDAPSGPQVDYMTPGKRDEMRRQARASLEGRGETRELDLLEHASGQTVRAVSLLNEGKLDAGTVLALQDTNIKAQKAAEIDPTFTPEQRKSQVDKLKMQAEVLDAVENIRRRGTKFHPEEQISNETAMTADVNKTLKKLKGRNDLLTLVEQQSRLVKARRDRTITDGTFYTLFNTVARATTQAGKAELGNTSSWYIFQSARQAGNDELESLFTSTKAKNATSEQRLNSQVNFAKQYLEATENGLEISKDKARAIARRAVSYETGIDLRGRGE